jgi:nicotinamidase-related amidase
MTIALLVIDMQVGLFEGEPSRHDADGVIRRRCDSFYETKLHDIFEQHGAQVKRNNVGYKITCFPSL